MGPVPAPTPGMVLSLPGDQLPPCGHVAAEGLPLLLSSSPDTSQGSPRVGQAQAEDPPLYQPRPAWWALQKNMLPPLPP